MSAKQDRVAPRTASDLERKYNIKKRFSEVLGLVDDTREKVDSETSKLSNKISGMATSFTRSTEKIALAVEGMKNGVQLQIGYTFDEKGLNITKQGQEMSNLLDDTGMYVKKNGSEVLTANKDGVDAFDLHAKTYLKIGKENGRSRFEDYGEDRTACFWIGG